jgi:hypothetical protein
VHGTALGIGERVGNAQMELILLNLKLLGELEGQDTTKLVEYCETAARACHWQIPINYPLVGRDAFRTSTGVHAAAIIKAESKGDAWLADRIYSGVPAGMFGRQQEICIGFMSGISNVTYWLKRRSHTTLPLSASIATRRSCVFVRSPIGELRYRRLPNATGDERLPIGIRHARFSPDGDHFEGRFVSVDRPSRFGPRHSGQSDAPSDAIA